MRSHLWLTYAAIGLVVTGCTRTIEVDPFLLTKEELKSTAKILAVAPVTIPSGLPNPQAIQDEFDQRIHDKLNNARFSIVYPHEYTTIWERLEEEAGGFADSTGVRDEKKISAAVYRTFSELGATFEPDAILFPNIVVIEANFKNGKARWDGAEESIKLEAWKDFWIGSPSGTVGALSLSIRVENKTGDDIYVKSGGIQLLSKMSGQKFVLVPRQSLFADDDLIQKAVDIALDPLVD